jgi:Na+:H+ antiporter, NhaA family
MRHDAVLHHGAAVPRAHLPAGERAFRYVTERFLLLPLGAAIALAWANIAPENYFRFTRIVAFPINEIGMALFLALVAQEVLEAFMPGGALHTWKRWALPLVGAIGGLVGAAGVYLVYVQLHYETVLANAWPAAVAIDVAAAYYVVKLIWRRTAALPFLLLLALATDLIGLLIVALQHPSLYAQPAGLSLVAAAIVGAALMRRFRVRSFWAYIAFCGPIAWIGLYLCGLHPALALLPIVPFLPREPRRADPFAEPPDDDAVHHFEHEWNEVVQVVLFLFGLANAGVILRGYDTGTGAVLAAALIGRPVGILIAVGLAVAAGLHLPRRVGWRELAVVALATSSGFTFALLFATGSVAPGPMLAQIKLGALLSVVAAPLAIALAKVLHVQKSAR